jgi:hypothetical protein
VELTGGNGSVQNQFHNGDSVSIGIKYLSHIDLDNACVSVRLNHLHGIDVWGTSTESKSFLTPIRQGNGQIRLNIDHLPLLAGTYDLSVVIADHSGIHEYDHWEKRIRIDVIQNGTFDTGIVDIKSHWQLDA